MHSRTFQITVQYKAKLFHGAYPPLDTLSKKPLNEEPVPKGLELMGREEKDVLARKQPRQLDEITLNLFW